MTSENFPKGNDLDTKNFDFLDENLKKELQMNLSYFFLPDSIKRKQIEFHVKHLKSNDRMALILAFVGSIFNVYSSHLYLTFTVTDNPTNNTRSINIFSFSTVEVEIYRIFSSFCTLGLIILIARHFILLHEFQIFKSEKDCSSKFYQTNLFWQLIVEVFVCSIHSPPYFQKIFIVDRCKVDIDLFLSSLVTLRVYLFIKYFAFYSSWADEKSQKICYDCNTEGGISFAIKAELKERPYTVVGVLMIISIVICGYALRNVEVPFMVDVQADKFLDWRYIQNGLWCIFITILTVGFGDFYPQTIMGRVIAVVACLWGTCLISLMVVSLSISVELNHREQKAYNEIRKYQNIEKLKINAIELIRFCLKLKKFPKKREDITDNEERLKYVEVLDKLKHTIEKFKTHRKFAISEENRVTTDSLMIKLKETILFRIENLLFNSKNEINTLCNYISCSQDIHEEIKNSINKLEVVSQKLYSKINQK